MKQFILSIGFSAVVFCIQAQTKPAPAKMTEPVQAPAQKDSTPFELKVYQNAMLFGDLQVAKNEIYQLLTKYPDNLGYMDSLARIYFSLNAYPQSLLASKIVLEKDQRNTPMLELSAISYDALGSKKEALEAYEKLYGITKRIDHQYQIAVLQYSLKRFGECEVSTNEILANPKAEQEKMNINIDNQNSQEVPMKAAVLNLRGVLYKEMGQNDKAKDAFEQSIKIMPDFALAKANLELLNKPEEKTEEKKKK